MDDLTLSLYRHLDNLYIKGDLTYQGYRACKRNYEQGRNLATMPDPTTRDILNSKQEYLTKKIRAQRLLVESLESELQTRMEQLAELEAEAVRIQEAR